MSITFGTASWGFRETPLEQQLAITRTLGLTTLELGIAGHENDVLQTGATDETIGSVRALFKKHGIAITHASTGNDFTSADPVAVAADLAKVKIVIEIARKLDIRFLRIFAGFSAMEDVPAGGDRWRRMVASLNAAVAHAARHDIVLTVETHGGVRGVPQIPGSVVHFHSTSTSPRHLERWLSEVDPRLRLLFDPANLGAVGMDTEKIIALYDLLRPRIASMHLKDFRPATNARKTSATLEAPANASDIGKAVFPCAAGEGPLDYNRLLAAFAGYEGAGFIEYELTADIEDGLRRSLKTLRA
ncbi:MAG: sugar phosphate isomerase/epimerase [Opitutaceae bacterium]|jgi:sugar phosphate isomerase/epimerase|nr:sugar phosphate isomerase/epimerase [Opitutaceae bacterium]